MSLVGYNGALTASEQPAAALSAIYSVFIFGMVLMAVIVIVILSFYHLDEEYPRIIQELLEREALHDQKSA